MNQDLYRIIFNRARGIWMAVQETATACRAGRTAAFTGMALAAPLALAQIIADPAATGRERPMVLKSANGTRPSISRPLPRPA